MIVVIPHSGDPEYRAALASALKTHGGLGSHRLLCVNPVEGSDGFFEEVRQLFMAADVKHVDAPVTQARLFRVGMHAATMLPIGPNEPPTPPLLWLEPGWLPASREWASDMSTAFYQSGKPVLANTVKMPPLRLRSAGREFEQDGGVTPEGPFVMAYLYPRSSPCFRQISGDGWRDSLRFELIAAVAQYPNLPFVKFETPVSHEVPEPRKSRGRGKASAVEEESPEGATMSLADGIAAAAV